MNTEFLYVLKVLKFSCIKFKAINSLAFLKWYNKSLNVMVSAQFTFTINESH